MIVRTDEITLREFLREDLQRRITEARDLRALRFVTPVIVIKHSRVVERDLEAAVHARTAIQLTLKQASSPRFIVRRAEARAAQTVGLCRVEGVRIGCEAQTTLAHLLKGAIFFPGRGWGVA